MTWKSLFTVVFVIVVAMACQIQIGPTRPPPPCPIEDLLLDKDVFSEDFFRGLPSEESAPARFGIDKIGVGFGSTTKTGGVSQDVYLGASTSQTVKQFADFVRSEFSPRKGWTEWYIPDSFDYQGSVADQYRFGCYRHITSGVESCQAIGQYGPYLIRLHVNMDSLLTYQDLGRVLPAVDEKAAQCLGE
jgi:hypothetical protein